MTAQLPLFAPTRDAPVIRDGTLDVTHTADGMTLLYVNTVRGAAWLELTPEQQRWLRERIVNEVGVGR